MIRHLPEGLVPFEDCGYARQPLHPLEGQEIRLGCLCDGAAPVWESADGRSIPGRPGTREHCYTWALPAEKGTLRYRFVSGAESTPWFETDILRPVSVTRPLRTGLGWAELVPGVYLCAEGEKGGAALTLRSAPREAESPLRFGGDALWSLGTLSCTEITLLLRPDGTPARMETTLRGGQRHVYGTGERFDGPDQQGRGSCGQVVEHFTQQGPWSYLPMPMFLTDGGFGWFRDAGENVRLAFGTEVHIESAAGEKITDHLLLGTPAEQLRAYLNLTGECMLPPEWAFGLWISANGWHCDADVDEQLSMLKKYDCPASVMVLEAWSDESTFYRWNAVWPDPAGTVRRVRERGLHLVLWQIPVLKALHDCPEVEPVQRDWEEAIAKGYVVRRENGSPYVVPDKWFAGSLLPDFTNPEACRWWFDKRQPLLEMGVEGFKTDGGEFLFGSNIRLADGTPGGEAHNRYPMQYVKAYHRWMKENGVEGVTFSRAGYTGAQTVPIHWAGDQLSTWEELRGQLSAGLSAGLVRRAVLELRCRRLRRGDSGSGAVSAGHGHGLLLPGDAVARGAAKRPVLRHRRSGMEQRPLPVESGQPLERPLHRGDRLRLRPAAGASAAHALRGSEGLREGGSPHDGTSLFGLPGRRTGAGLRGRIPAGPPSAGRAHRLPGRGGTKGLSAPRPLEAFL